MMLLTFGAKAQEDSVFFAQKLSSLDRLQFAFPNPCFPSPCELTPFDSLVNQPESWIFLSLMSSPSVPGQFLTTYCLDTASIVMIFSGRKKFGYTGPRRGVYLVVLKNDSLHILSAYFEAKEPFVNKIESIIVVTEGFSAGREVPDKRPYIKHLFEPFRKGFWVSSHIRSNRPQDRNTESTDSFVFEMFAYGQPVYHFEHWTLMETGGNNWAEVVDSQTLMRIRAILALAKIAGLHNAVFFQSLFE